MSTTIRLATIQDAAGIAQVHVDSWRTTYRDIVPDDYLAALSYEQRQKNWERILGQEQSRGVTIVAADASGKIIGFINGGSNREAADYAGELYSIYLLAACQGQGIGKRLAVSLVERLLAMGISSMVVNVLAANPACYFYEALGAQYLRTVQIEIGGKALAERIYGWHDIRTILPREQR